MDGTITEIATTEANVFAFSLSGELSDTDLSNMADEMLTAFEQHDKVNMLLIFEGYEGSETFASLQGNVMKVQVKALSKVDKYAVVGAPGFAETMIGASDMVLPVASKAFEANEVDQAWEFVGAKPLS